MRTRVVLVAAGAMVIAYAIGGVFQEVGVVVFLVVALVVHDALWMPLVLGMAAIFRKKFARSRVGRGG